LSSQDVRSSTDNDVVEDTDVIIEDGVGDAPSSSNDEEAKKILNMARYSLHPLVNDEKSVFQIGKKKLGDLQSKREKKRQNIALLKEAVYGAHESKLEKEG